MTESQDLIKAPFELGLPGAERPASAWITAPANSPEAPPPSTLPRLETPPSGPLIIYAERRPRLSGPELLARHRASVPSPRVVAIAPPPRPAADRPTRPRRPAWWPALIVGTLGTGLLSACSLLL